MLYDRPCKMWYDFLLQWHFIALKFSVWYSSTKRFTYRSALDGTDNPGVLAGVSILCIRIVGRIHRLREDVLGMRAREFRPDVVDVSLQFIRFSFLDFKATS